MIEKEQKKSLHTRNTFGDELIVEGRNAVIEALKSGRTIDKLFISSDEQEGSIVRIISMARERGIVISKVDKRKLDFMSPTKAHQGVLAYCAAKEYKTIDDMLKLAESKNEPPLIVICDEISDPHNLGAILRTADICGAHGVIIPKHRNAGLTAVVAKSSAGAIEYIPVARVTNISSAIDELKEKGLWIYGADAEGGMLCFDNDMTGAAAIIIGSEGFGISRLVRKKCDFLIKIPMLGNINSLNASVACGILLYETMRQRYNKSQCN